MVIGSAACRLKKGDRARRRRSVEDATMADAIEHPPAVGGFGGKTWMQEPTLFMAAT
jgi:hypothetical protein